MLLLMIITGLCLGFISGLAVNYLSDVLPFYRKFAFPACYHCHQTQSWSGFILLKPCGQCHAKKSWRHWLVYLFYTITGVTMAIVPPTRLGLWIGLLLLVFFGVIAVIDLEYRVVLDQVSLAGVVLGLVIGYWLHGLLPTLLGGLVGFATMLLLYYTGIWYTRWTARMRGQETGTEVALGFGDVNLSGILGLVLGWPGIVAGLLLAIILGGIVSLIFILILLVRRRWRPLMAIPYAPFLVLGAGILLYFR